MKKTLTILFSLMVARFSYAQQGEILHTVFDPDTVTFTSSYPIEDWVKIDLDQDGIEEWLFRGWTSGHQTSELLIYVNAGSPALHPDTLNLAKKLRFLIFMDQSNIGDTISNYTWPNRLFNAIYSVDWTYEDDSIFPHNMMATRHEVDEGYCYGWIEYTVHFYGNAPSYGAEHVDLILHQMAYCTVPNYPMRLGQTSFEWGVDDQPVPLSATVRPNPTNGQFTVIGEGLQTVEVYDIIGQKVASLQASGGETSIDLGGQPAGVYLVSVTDQQGRRCVRKVVKQ